MQYAMLGGSDLKVSRVCLGTMTFGTQNSEADAHRQLEALHLRYSNPAS